MLTCYLAGMTEKTPIGSGISPKLTIALISGASLVVAAVIGNYHNLWPRNSRSDNAAQAGKPNAPVSSATSSMILALPTTDSKHVASLTDSIRRTLQLRRLDLMESGKPLSSSPVGTYSFVSMIELEDADTLGLRLGATASLAPFSAIDFEVYHRPDGEFVLLAYASEDAAARSTGAIQNEALQLAVFAQPFPPYAKPLLIPFSRVAWSNRRELRPLVDVMDIRLR